LNGDYGYRAWLNNTHGTDHGKDLFGKGKGVSQQFLTKSIWPVKTAMAKTVRRRNGRGPSFKSCSPYLREGMQMSGNGPEAGF